MVLLPEQVSLLSVSGRSAVLVPACLSLSMSGRAFRLPTRPVAMKSSTSSPSTFVIGYGCKGKKTTKRSCCIKQ